MIIIFVLVLVAIVLWPAFASASRKRQSYELHKRVIELGDVTQYDYDGVVSTLGNPNSVSGIAGGGKLVQWMAPRYHIAMSFGPDGRCLGIDHESVV